jgi:hypothetical protein
MELFAPGTTLRSSNRGVGQCQPAANAPVRRPLPHPSPTPLGIGPPISCCDRASSQSVSPTSRWAGSTRPGQEVAARLVEEALPFSWTGTSTLRGGRSPSTRAIRADAACRPTSHGCPNALRHTFNGLLVQETRSPTNAADDLDVCVRDTVPARRTSYGRTTRRPPRRRRRPRTSPWLFPADNRAGRSAPTAWVNDSATPPARTVPLDRIAPTRHPA